MTQPIHNILVSGGTHGNELSGIQAVKNWLLDQAEISKCAPSLAIQLAIINQKAVDLCRRFVDEDLNRQFTLSRLAQSSVNDPVHEVALAHKLNQQYGPKGASQTDLVIDIHNTTSNLGPTLIIIKDDNFHRQLARYVKHNMPEAVILIEDYQDYADFGYFCTIGKRGLMIEVGPQAHGTLKARAYAQTVQMTKLILAFVELHNINKVPNLSEVEAFRLGSEIKYPLNDSGTKMAMIHPQLDQQDFTLLQKGAPCFIDFDGNTIVWSQGDTYPHFIGEAAYNHLHVAFATSSKISW